MADFKINGKTVVTQSGVDEPVLASNVTFPTGHVLQVVSYYTATVGTTTITQTDAVVNGITKDVTPKGTASDFLIHCRWFGEVTSPEDVGFANFQRFLG